MAPIRVIRVSILEKLLRKQDWVKYLTIRDWHEAIIDKKILLGKASRDLAQTVDKYVSAYLYEKKMPPAEIATAILNVADDVMKKRNIVLRSGDYIALKNFMRAK